MPNSFLNDTREWLEADGLGGFASGTVCGVRTRRYHALLLVADGSPSRRVALVNGVEVWLETPSGTFPLSTQAYDGDAIWPLGRQSIIRFSTEPWPTWEFQLPGGITVRHELFVPRDVPGVALRWSIVGNRQGLKLHVRPLLAGRDYHQLHHENPAFRSDNLAPQEAQESVAWRPYSDLPQVWAQANASFTPGLRWFRNFAYAAERERGLDFQEDLASPGEFHWDLERDDEAVLLLSAGKSASEWNASTRQERAASTHEPDVHPTVATFVDWERRERGRRTALSPLERAADAYFVRRGAGMTIIAGYPWFTDWGRDTFIALRGLGLRPARLKTAGQILRAWAVTVSQGMLPNRFPDGDGEPEYNSVDASLWYIVAVHEYLTALSEHQIQIEPADKAAMLAAVQQILTGYARGTRFGIRLDDDGLLACGEPGVQLTWMDAKVGDWVVTPRIGKPVEIQALWLNALWIGALWTGARQHAKWNTMLRTGLAAFRERFWNADGYLHDVVDVDHQPRQVDSAFRPNQVFAVGGLPLQILHGDEAHSVVRQVQERLLTPLGLRTLDPAAPQYCPVYSGGVRERDGAYHQGTVWPWLIGPFVEAMLRVGGDSSSSRAAAGKLLQPLNQHLQAAGLGHISEIADGAEPHHPRGCPFQAWSLGEYLRVRDLLQKPDRAESATTAQARPSLSSR